MALIHRNNTVLLMTSFCVQSKNPILFEIKYTITFQI